MHLSVPFCYKWYWRHYAKDSDPSGRPIPLSCPELRFTFWSSLVFWGQPGRRPPFPQLTQSDAVSLVCLQMILQWLARLYNHWQGGQPTHIMLNGRNKMFSCCWSIEWLSDLVSQVRTLLQCWSGDASSKAREYRSPQQQRVPEARSSSLLWGRHRSGAPALVF